MSLDPVSDGLNTSLAQQLRSKGAQALAGIGRGIGSLPAGKQPWEPDEVSGDHVPVKWASPHDVNGAAPEGAAGPGDMGAQHGWSAGIAGAQHGWNAGAPSRGEQHEPSQGAQNEENSHGEAVARLHAASAATFAAGTAPVDARQMFADASAARLNSGTAPMTASSFGTYSAANHANANPRAGFGQPGEATRASGPTVYRNSSVSSGTSAKMIQSQWGGRRTCHQIPQWGGKSDRPGQPEDAAR